ncbi:cupin domain-containing protein [Cupriavidus sp. D39]|uniref:cupin domain-containing protein n=1 Tax=Cupriavidus sp. D39 TaxID=2997877 RepID=UPI0022717C6E|nr:cupin domain-containing protein [Cupriavidus sp. D39]MCY0855049.1 cupin domain-containing protein [Cupriavidus sp. D39]
MHAPHTRIAVYAAYPPVSFWKHERKLHETKRILTAAALLATSGLAMTLAHAQEGIGRTEIHRHDLGSSGREVVQVRVDFAPGAAFGRHTHPGDEIAYVLDGTLEYQVDGKHQHARLRQAQCLRVLA